MAEPQPGNLWVGDVVDVASGEATGEQLELEAADLTTHGVILGMTGSGKTGLGIIALEEALLAGIPVLVLDPRGDMGNLLLNFPELRPEDFAPWVSDSDARQAGVSIEAYASQTADLWRGGLERQGIGPGRLERLRTGADFTIYTPGSSAGVPLNIVGSLAAPDLSWEAEAETLRDEIEGTVTSLLALVGVEADQISSREHVLMANLIENAWRAGRDLDLGILIGEVQEPPLRKLGVFELDTFFPPKERTELALKLNALVASPAFAAWAEGPPIDPSMLLGTPGGKPQASIIYLAHLSDQERQLVVTLLLSKVVTWMRGQKGTSDLRALVYMDEVFGFVPPTAAPPAKKPILTILKQARAFGVGMILSTQNPVDIDYKAMSNAGTWLVGRLQTERDKARVLEGLKSVEVEDRHALAEAASAAIVVRRRSRQRSPRARAADLLAHLRRPKSQALDHSEEWEAVVGPLDDGLDVDQATAVDYDDRDFRDEPPAEALYVLPDAPITTQKFFKSAAAEPERRLIAERKLELQANRALKLYSRPREGNEEFELRCDAAAQDRADEETARIRTRLEKRATTLQRAIDEARLRVEELESEERARANRDLIAGAGEVLGALFGDRRRTRSIARAAERAVGSRTGKSRSWSAQVSASKKQAELAELEQQILDEVADIDAKWTGLAAEIETIEVGLEAADVRATQTAFVWVPR